MDYNFREIEKKWQSHWQNSKTYKVEVDPSKPKYYVLDMFPYPSGAGLHVGHPLGYIASDIYSRYKKLCGFNVLHPMGYDAFGLPAEQYAIQTGQHPAITTTKNIARYREQLDKIGFCYDWDREVKTCDPDYYHWTQWAFLQMFNHWYNNKTQKAEHVKNLIAVFEKEGNGSVEAACSQKDVFSADEWKKMSEKEQQLVLLNYRLAYLADTMVNWCPALGTVLANDEVVNGVSVRGGHEVVQKEMKQWSLRISAYAQRMLEDIEEIEWTDSLKEIQRNWIGRSEGAEMVFKVKDSEVELNIFTTRPDTSWGVSFMVLAPESKYVDMITTAGQKAAVQTYLEETKKRSERDRMADVKKVTGVFTGAYAINPITNKEIPVYVADYVLAGYGTGAIMAVPGHDSRDFKFARHFNLPVIQVVKGKDEEPSDTNTWEDANESKDGIMINSGFIDGLEVKESIRKTIDFIEQNNIGKGKINYRLRDAIFSRQRYWGEPFPVYFKEDVPNALDEKDLPLLLPEVDKFLPTEDGQPPLGRATNWSWNEKEHKVISNSEPGACPLELSTMPGFAGSSAYYYRYMDPKNNKELVSKEANNYWQDVDLYIGGTEHATGHLVYARFWNKFLYDMGLVCKKEPFKKLINQGMIQGRSSFVYRVKNTNKFVSVEKKDDHEVTEIHADISLVSNDILDTEAFKNWNPEYKNAEFILNENGQYKCGWAVEKMSKSMYNVVNPDDIVENYGADTLRMYEMFLGPLEQSKPWDTNGIDGVFKFFRKTWRLFYDKDSNFLVSNDDPTKAELKILHKTIKKIKSDIEGFSFNTSVSAFMICVNELGELKCNKKAILEPLMVILSPFAPHIAEELWNKMGNTDSITGAKFPEFKEEYLVESSFEYPVSFNGKMRFKIEFPLDMSKEEVEKAVLADEKTIKWLEGKPVKKIIVVPNKIINVVM
ncbi:MAG: leucine--tRNA ligase [Bacteroidetes bacterium GWF2_38_335]|nr:MAG: leucine--tRNA ligase [Bacteroidetes bacterium GWF2_38_335]OFY81282.1 MAG: leucine--tRNA ligase [Bacteroidetes bacterium RIFOXYA12_FULL_38_20]HBS85401.1 leucine--tRNA ligase [Bacteroidales bacterium]